MARFLGFSANGLFLLVLTVIATPGAAVAHDIGVHIDNCACDERCYTDEVSELECTGDHAHFLSNGLPDESHPLMKGIRGSNQQFPAPHHHETSVPLSPKLARHPTATAEGAIGIAVNGVPIFSPDTQGPVQPDTGRPVSALAAGELDECGGHAGRGDDYHYHTAPRCLIEELGPQRIEENRQPIGFAMDGFPILALGWFDPANDIEGLLDDCRGINDAAQHYFYNVQHEADWNVLNCFSGTVQKGIDRDSWEARTDIKGGEIVGSPVRFLVDSYELRTSGSDACHVMIGTMSDLQVLRTDQSVERIDNENGTLFYCNPGCYGQFFETDSIRGVRGRTMYFERPVSTCPSVLGLASLPMFEPYEGPAQTRKGPPPTRK